jgi:hypothetical protein
MPRRLGGVFVDNERFLGNRGVAMNALVLGAGASKSYGASPTGERMPIARDFFRTFNRLAIASNPWVLVGGILTFAERYHQLSATDFFHRDIDIEEFHSEVETSLLAAIARLKTSDSSNNVSEFALPWGAYNQLVYLFASTVNEIQNGPISESHLRLAQALRPEDSVLTFNWDTLMDRALCDGTRWRVDDGYGIAPRRIFRDGWVDPVCQAQIPIAPTLLKLHGSSNWITSASYVDPRSGIITPTQLSPIETYCAFEKATKQYSCHDGRYMDGYARFSYGYYPPNILDDSGKPVEKGHVLLRVIPRYQGSPQKGAAGSDGLVSMPLIIPPVKEKRYDFFGPLFSDIWKKAEDCLAQATNIILIGYSFPRTDHRSVKLFRDAFMRCRSMPNIKIIDPAPSRIASIFRDEFGISSDHIKVYTKYFDETFDLAELFI